MKITVKTVVFLFFVIAAVLLFCSCSTLQKDFVYSASSKTDNIRTAEEIEKTLVLYGLAKNAHELERAKKELDALLASPSSDSSYLALVYALYADYYLLKNNKSGARKMLKIAEKNNPHEEYVKLIVSRFMPAAEASDYLAKNCTENPDFYRLKAELGVLQYSAGNYTEAVVAFDSALEFLPEVYAKRFESLRSFSAAFYTVDKDIKKSTAQILQQDKILLIDMAVLTQENTQTLDFMTGTAQWKPEMLFQRLKAAGWYADSTASPETSAKRKDAALFLWHLIAGNDSRLLSKYSLKYAKRGKTPLEDVAMDGVYFDSVLGSVEEDVIPLVGGRRFEPDGTVSGLEFYHWLKKAETVR